jgi:hypothetical protein
LKRKIAGNDQCEILIIQSREETWLSPRVAKMAIGY